MTMINRTCRWSTVHDDDHSDMSTITRTFRWSIGHDVDQSWMTMINQTWQWSIVHDEYHSNMTMINLAWRRSVEHNDDQSFMTIIDHAWRWSIGQEMLMLYTLYSVHVISNLHLRKLTVSNIYDSMNYSYLVTILTFGTQAWDRRLVQGYRPKHHRHYYSFLCPMMPCTLAFFFIFCPHRLNVHHPCC